MKAPGAPRWRSIWPFLFVAGLAGILAAHRDWQSTVQVIAFNSPTGWFADGSLEATTAADNQIVATQSQLQLAPVPEADPALQVAWIETQLGAPFGAIENQFAAPPLRFTTESNSFVSPGVASIIQPSQGFTGLTTPLAPTTSGSWVANDSGNWSTAANWSGGNIADGAGAIAHFDLTNITTEVTVILDSSRTIGNLNIGDTNGTNHYTITPILGSTLTFDTGDGSFSLLIQRSFSAETTIAAPIFLKNDLGIENDSASPFTITGNISSSAPAPFLRTLVTVGEVRIAGNISDGSTGATVALSIQTGKLTLTGTNTYTGGTVVSSGTLLINGDNSGATGTVNILNGSGTVLGGHGTVGGSVLVSGTITGDTVTTTGKLTLHGDVTLGTGEGMGGTYLANLSGSLSDLLDIKGTFGLGPNSTLAITGSADNVTTYILATFGSHSDTFGTVTGMPSGYSLVYTDTDIELVPIPEPATWIGGALALGVVAFALRRKLRLSA